ncbi:MAG: type IV pilin protein [Prochlorococcus sp.]
MTPITHRLRNTLYKLSHKANPNTYQDPTGARAITAGKLQYQSSLRTGFTLTELLIALVIIGILSSIAIPNFINQSQKAKSSEARSIHAAILKQAFAMNEGGMPTTKIIDFVKDELVSANKASNSFRYQLFSHGKTNGLLSTVVLNAQLKDGSRKYLRTCLNFSGQRKGLSYRYKKLLLPSEPSSMMSGCRTDF